MASRMFNFYPELLIHLYFFSNHKVYFSRDFQNTKDIGKLITGVSMNNSNKIKNKLCLNLMEGRVFWFVHTVQHQVLDTLF